MYRPGMFKILALGLLIGLIAAPALWIGSAASTSAQTLPFTPTPEPTELPTSTPTVQPTTTPEPTTAQPTQPPIVIVATATPQPATATAQPIALPPGYGRDQCDPNHTLQQPCALATETDITNLNFNDAAVDVFSFLLKGGRQYRIAATVGNTGGIDPAIDVFVAGTTDTPVGSNDDEKIGNPSAAVTVTVQVDSWYIVQVSNKAPGKVEGKTYTLNARSVAAAGDTSTAQATNPDDLVGNAYDAEHAVRLAWNVPYDLSMVCPDTRPGACYAGRHTFLLVPVKGNVPFTALTYDLGAGVDTVLTVYKPAPTQTQSGSGVIPGWVSVAANDDIAPGWTLRSEISFTPDWNSMALLVVAPSNREDLPPMPADGRPGRYRLIVGSPELPNVKAALAAAGQDLPPTPVPPTPRPTGQPAPAAVAEAPAAAQDNREVIKEACPTGSAVVGTEETGLYAAAPPGSDDRIAAYPNGALVKLLGQCYRGWVKVQPADSVTPGWMWGPDLRPEELGGAPTPAGANGSTGTTASVQPTAAGATGTSSMNGTQATPTVQVPTVALVPLEPLDLPTVAPAKPAARAVTVEVCRAAKQGDGCGEPLAGLRVDLMLAATRQVLTGNVTDANGKVTLSVSVPDGSQIVLAIPALGLETPLGANVTEVPVRVPAGGS